MAEPVDLGTPRQPFPRLVSIETTGMCNAACTFCPHPLLDKNAEREYMSDETLEIILRECAEHREQIDQITLSFQNEPLMDPAVFDRIGRTRSVLGTGVKIALVSNASGLTEKRLRQMLDNPPDLLKISFNGLDRTEYESTMVGLRFDRTMRNIERLVRAVEGLERPHVLVNCVWTSAAERHGVLRVKRFWQERGLPVHVINVENRAGFFEPTQRELSTQRWNVRTWCKRPEEQLSVWPNGDVALCCNDWEKEVTLGNVHTISLADIWTGAVLGRYRASLRSGDLTDLSPCNVCMSAEVEVDGERYEDFGSKAESL